MKVLEVIISKPDYNLHYTSEKAFLADEVDLREALSITITTEMTLEEFAEWKFSQHNAYRIHAGDGMCPECNS